DGFLATVAATLTELILRASAAEDTVLVAGLAFTIFWVLGNGTLAHTVRTIADMFALGTIVRAWAITRAVTFFVTVLADVVACVVHSAEKKMNNPKLELAMVSDLL